MSNVTVRRRKGGDSGDAPAVVADGEDDKKAQAPAARRRQAPTIAENLERWGYAFGICGRFFTAIYELIIAVGLWVCPLCAREEKRLFQ